MKHVTGGAQERVEAGEVLFINRCEMTAKKIDPDSIGHCNCAHCGLLLVGEKTAKHVWAVYDQWPADMAPPVAVRTPAGKPLCESCGKFVKKAK